MERAIVDYHLDDLGEWVAHLTCGHRQHIRHQPPFRERPWILDPAGRTAHLGTVLNCPLCDGAESPEGLAPLRTTSSWDDQTVPAGLQRGHRLPEGTWGRLVVESGAVRFCAPGLDLGDQETITLVEPTTPQWIPPGAVHHVEPVGHSRFHLELFEVPPALERSVEGGPDLEGDSGGDPACWAHLLCPRCGTVLGSAGHRPECPEEFRG